MLWQVSCLAPVAHRRSGNDSRFSQTQVSRTVPVPPTILINTNLTGLVADHTRHTQKEPSRGPSSALAISEALDLRPARPGAPVLPCTPAALPRPQQTAALHPFDPRGPPRGRTSIPAHSSTGSPDISFRRPCVHVALTSWPHFAEQWSRRGRLQPPALRCGSRNA